MTASQTFPLSSDLDSFEELSPGIFGEFPTIGLFFFSFFFFLDFSRVDGDYDFGEEARG